MKKPFTRITPRKSCTTADGRVLQQAKGLRVAIGNSSALIIHFNWVDMAIGEQHTISLDFGSTRTAPEASAEAHAIIARLFPEYAA
jgi:hypothetical protein